MRINLPAFVGEDCEIGRGTVVYQFATIAKGTRIGENCSIGACAALTGPRIGDRCKISSGVVLGPGFYLEDDVFIGPNVTFANDLWPETSSEGFEEDELRNGNYVIIVKTGAAIGANSVILPGVTIGRYSVVGAGSVVTRDVPDGRVYKGNGTITPIPFSRRKHRMKYIQYDSCEKLP